MPELTALLNEAIHPQFIKRIEGGDLVLREDPDNAASNEFHLKASCRHFAMSLDQPSRGGMDGALPMFTNAYSRLKCKCDLIVFLPREELPTLVFLIEMKSLNNGDYLTQLRSSREFARYLIALLKLHGLGDFEVEYRGLLIKSRRIPAKGTTRLPQITFENRNGLEVCEWDYTRPLTLLQLAQAATYIFLLRLVR